jgi:hypothetical protein
MFTHQIKENGKNDEGIGKEAKLSKEPSGIPLGQTNMHLYFFYKPITTVSYERLIYWML